MISRTVPERVLCGTGRAATRVHFSDKPGVIGKITGSHARRGENFGADQVANLLPIGRYPRQIVGSQVAEDPYDGETTDRDGHDSARNLLHAHGLLLGQVMSGMSLWDSRAIYGKGYTLNATLAPASGV
jgi:hypothetical protein